MKSSQKTDPQLIAEFEVPGEPVSKSRARFTKRGSKTVAYTPQKTREGEIRVALAFRQSCSRLALNPTDTEIAYRVEAEFYNGTRQRRDVDNMTKLILDGLNGVAWVDDNQVMEIEARKEYVGKAGAHTTIRVFEIGRSEPPQGKCFRCGKPFRTFDSWTVDDPKGRKHCSAACAMEHTRDRNRAKCACCGEIFYKDAAAQKYCSMTCRDVARQVEVGCSECGSTFRIAQSTAAGGKTFYCSDQCRATARLRSKTFCVNGHRWSENLALTPKGARRCKACAHQRYLRRIGRAS